MVLVRTRNNKIIRPGNRLNNIMRYKSPSILAAICNGRCQMHVSYIVPIKADNMTCYILLGFAYVLSPEKTFVN
jgi:hypothetical protein